MEILVIIAGGTIDSESYKDTPKNVTLLKESIIPDAITYLANSENATNCTFLKWKRKDSKKYSKQQLNELVDIIKKSNQQNIMITFGTDKTPELARFLEKELEGTGKTVVITGAMKPLTTPKGSDGFKNLDVSLDSFGKLHEGVFVVAHGKVFLPDRLKKDLMKAKISGQEVKVRG